MRIPETRGPVSSALFKVLVQAPASSAADLDALHAMVAGQPYLSHSLLAPYINAGLLYPLEVCRKAEAALRDGYGGPIEKVQSLLGPVGDLTALLTDRIAKYHITGRIGEPRVSRVIADGIFDDLFGR